MYGEPRAGRSLSHVWQLRANGSRIEPYYLVWVAPIPSSLSPSFQWGTRQLLPPEAFSTGSVVECRRPRITLNSSFRLDPSPGGCRRCTRFFQRLPINFWDCQVGSPKRHSRCRHVHYRVYSRLLPANLRYCNPDDSDDLCCPLPVKNTTTTPGTVGGLMSFKLTHSPRHFSHLLPVVRSTVGEYV